jgi:hypothetical protein
MSESQMKTLFITFFDIKGIGHFFSFHKAKQSTKLIVETVKRLREALRRKRPELWLNDWILHHDHVPAHKAISVKQFLVKKSITEMKHPHYSPDFRLFPKIKSALKGRIFQDTEDIQRNVTMAPKAILQQSSRNVSNSWVTYIAAPGEYFEDEPSQ